MSRPIGGHHQAIHKSLTSSNLKRGGGFCVRLGSFIVMLPCWVLQGCPEVGRCSDWGIAGSLWSISRHDRDTLKLGRCRENLRLGCVQRDLVWAGQGGGWARKLRCTAGILCRSALRDTLRLDTAGILC